MGKPLDEPTKIMGFFPFSDVVLMFIATLENGLVALIVSKLTKGLFSFFLFMGVTVGIILIFTLKNIFPAGFFPGLYRHLTGPRLIIPGREKSEI